LERGKWLRGTQLVASHLWKKKREGSCLACPKIRATAPIGALFSKATYTRREQDLMKFAILMFVVVLLTLALQVEASENPGRFKRVARKIGEGVKEGGAMKAGKTDENGP
jgi:hypothetical protein